MSGMRRAAARGDRWWRECPATRQESSRTWRNTSFPVGWRGSAACSPCTGRCRNAGTGEGGRCNKYYFFFSPLDYVPYITVYNMFAHGIWIEIAVCLRWKIHTRFIWISCPCHIFMKQRQTLHVVAKTAHEIKKCMHTSAILFLPYKH